ncbi:uncharacterized protein LOC111640891 [Centruroides sculpturatus]|uniref:uncharacterized protein LOC111640891 n=1 Tax=Centruroides sculpturatus TaxID=218467 RepID=UPI000C6E3188|nr:uncharacterized protein LOC111640891 [Centruroides sculpturatus]
MRSTSSLLDRLGEECYELPPVRERACHSARVDPVVHRSPRPRRRESQLSQDGKTFFLKLHASWDVLTKYAEFLNMKMPIKKQEQTKKFNVRRTTLNSTSIAFSRQAHAFGKTESENQEEGIPLAWCENEEEEAECSCKSLWNLWCLSPEGPFMYNRELIPDEPQYVTCVFSRQQEKQLSAYLMRDNRMFLNSRRCIVWLFIDSCKRQ